MLKKLIQKYGNPQLSFQYHPCRWFSTEVDQILKTEPECINIDNQYDVLEQAIIPLYRIPYEKQLEYKNFFIQDVIKDLRMKVAGFTKKDIRVDPILPSPVTKYYRNKDEYNVRMGIDGDPKTYGLFTGKPVKGKVYSIRPTKLPTIRPKHNEVLEVFEKYVKSSPLAPCYELHDGGFWRRVVVRSNCEGEIMLVIVNHPRDFHEDDIYREERKIVEHFDAHNCHIDSMYHVLSKYVRADSTNSNISLIHGKAHLYENFLGYKFRISPDAFFQINVKAAEVLHQEVLNLANLNSNTTLLDLCCGVGVFSITASKYVRNCLGIESSITSVEDAIHNASINYVENCEFIPGHVETRLNSVLKSFEVVSHLVVICNPGRSGLHPRAIDIIRNATYIKKLIYISCKPDHLMTKQNFISLMSPMSKKCKTPPFKLTRVKAVDLFPHTYHYEMILVFESNVFN